jgi:hypothetical protein
MAWPGCPLYNSAPRASGAEQGHRYEAQSTFPRPCQISDLHSVSLASIWLRSAPDLCYNQQTLI